MYFNNPNQNGSFAARMGNFKKLNDIKTMLETGQIPQSMVGNEKAYELLNALSRYKQMTGNNGFDPEGFGRFLLDSGVMSQNEFNQNQMIANQIMQK